MKVEKKKKNNNKNKNFQKKNTNSEAVMKYSAISVIGSKETV